VREALGLLQRCNEEDAAQLREAVAQRSGPGVVRACHRILGSCKLVGALALADACSSVQDAARAQHWPAVAERMQDFELQCARLAQSVEALSSKIT
jgi:HPt (histidine-containing phosphotransfer) domain-containing protein